jgi:hypothetical protein
MHEIELLRELRAGLPGPRAESRAAARAGLIARAEHSVRVPRPAAGSLWRRPRLRLAAAALALAAILIALPIGIHGGGGEVQPAVGQVLRETAEVAATQAPLAPGPGQYLFTRSKDAYLLSTAYSPRCATHPCDREHPWQATDEWSVLVPSERQAWISLDGTRKGRVHTVSGRPSFVSAGQRAGWVAAGSPSLSEAGQVDDTTLSGGDTLDGSDLPTDPAALRRLLEARKIPGVQGPPGEAETFVLIGDMLRETYLPPVVRAAIYRLTAELSGVELLGEVRDPVGRPGTGVAFSDRHRGIRHELIFDPETSVLLGERESTLGLGVFGFDAPAGTPIGYAAYLESKVVDSVGEGAPPGAGAVNETVGCYDGTSLHANTTIVHGADPIATCRRLGRLPFPTK